MKTLQKKKRFFLTSCILVLFLSVMLISCGKKPNYEGGHIVLFYDTNKWEISYADTEPDVTFNLLHSDDSIITIMMFEGDVAVVDNFHKDLIDMLQVSCEVTEKGKTDRWDSQSWCYYEDLVKAEESETMIIYAKELDDKIMVGVADITFLDSGEENTALVNEALDIFSTIKYSEREEIGEIAQNENSILAEFFYNNLNAILRFETDDEETVNNEEQSDSKGAYISDDEFSELEYIEKVIMEDYEGNESEYYAYVPIGNSGCDEGFVSYWEHGLSYTAFLYNNAGTTSFLYSSLEDSVDFSLKFWNDSDYGYEDIQVGEVQKNGNDRYQIISAQDKDYNGTSYEIIKISYMDVLDTGVGILWELEISEIDMDSESSLIIEELAKCYNISPDELQVSGEWAVNDMEHSLNQQDAYEPAVGDNVLEKVDGYQYMGLTTLLGRFDDEGIECPVMVPMGWRTSIKDTRVNSFLHGISVAGSMCNTRDAEHLVDEKFKILSDNYNDSYRNIRKGDVITLPEYNNDAYYVVLTYEKKSSFADGYVPEAVVTCFIRFDEEYFLRYEITLSQEEYDASTNALLKELEAAYGLDLSEYYYQ